MLRRAFDLVATIFSRPTISGIVKVVKLANGQAAASIKSSGRHCFEVSDLFADRFLFVSQPVPVHQPLAVRRRCDFLGILALQDIELQDSGVSTEHISTSHKRELLRVVGLLQKQRLIEAVRSEELSIRVLQLRVNEPGT